MSRELLLLRHAKSSWESNVRGDFERPLAPRGLKDAVRLATWMQSQSITPDFIVSSPAARAKQTVQQICTQPAPPVERICWEEQLYLADLATLFGVLADIPDTARRPMLVGHNPGMDELLVYLCGDGLPHTASGKLMTTAALARIELPVDWSRLAACCGRLIDLVRPKDLRQLPED